MFSTSPAGHALNGGRGTAPVRLSRRAEAGPKRWSITRPGIRTCARSASAEAREFAELEPAASPRRPWWLIHESEYAARHPDVGPPTGPAVRLNRPGPGTWKRGRLPAGRLPRLDPGAPTGPQGVGLGPLREPVGVLALQLEHALGVVEQRLARAVEERLLAGGVQVAQLALEGLVVQLVRVEAELPRHGSLLPSPSPSRIPGWGHLFSDGGSTPGSPAGTGCRTPEVKPPVPPPIPVGGGSPGSGGDDSRPPGVGRAGRRSRRQPAAAGLAGRRARRPGAGAAGRQPQRRGGAAAGRRRL